MSDVTRILSQIESGDPQAAEQLLPLVYDELRKLAATKLAQERPGQTLQALRWYIRRIRGWWARRQGSGVSRLEQPRPFLRGCRRSDAADPDRAGAAAGEPPSWRQARSASRGKKRSGVPVE